MTRVFCWCLVAMTLGLFAAAHGAALDWRDFDGPGEIPVVETAPLDLAALAAEDAAQPLGPLRVAVIQPLETVLPDAGLLVLEESGAMTALVRVHAPEAAWLRLVFEDWAGSAAAAISVSDPRRPELPSQMLEGAPGPDGTFWSPIFFTNEVIVEYRAVGIDAREATARLALVVCGYRGFDVESPGTVGTASAPDRGGPLLCQTDWNCVGPLPTVDRDALATWIVCTNQGCNLCSGTLMNRNWCNWWNNEWSCAHDNPLMFLTAASCGVTSQNLHTTVLIFKHYTSGCGGPPPDLATLPQARAETVLINNSQTDIALLGIGSEAFASVPVYSWNAPTTNYWFATSCVFSSAGFMLHHPQGSHLRHTALEKCGPFDEEPLRSSVGTCTAANGYRLVFVGDGRAEPGSHGAPIFLGGDNRIISVLSCILTAADCGVVQAASGARLDLTEPQLRPFIDPVRPIYVNPAHVGFERGTAAEPLRSLARAAFAVVKTDPILIAPGSSHGGRAYLGRPCVVRLASPGASAVIGE